MSRRYQRYQLYFTDISVVPFMSGQLVHVNSASAVSQFKSDKRAEQMYSKGKLVSMVRQRARYQLTRRFLHLCNMAR